MEVYLWFSALARQVFLQLQLDRTVSGRILTVILGITILFSSAKTQWDSWILISLYMALKFLFERSNKNFIVLYKVYLTISLFFWFFGFFYFMELFHFYTIPKWLSCVFWDVQKPNNQILYLQGRDFVFFFLFSLFFFIFFSFEPLQESHSVLDFFLSETNCVGEEKPVDLSVVDTSISLRGFGYISGGILSLAAGKKIMQNVEAVSAFSLKHGMPFASNHLKLFVGVVKLTTILGTSFIAVGTLHTAYSGLQDAYEDFYKTYRERQIKGFDGNYWRDIDGHQLQEPNKKPTGRYNYENYIPGLFAKAKRTLEIIDKTSND